MPTPKKWKRVGGAVSAAVVMSAGVAAAGATNGEPTLEDPISLSETSTAIRAGSPAPPRRRDRGSQRLACLPVRRGRRRVR